MKASIVDLRYKTHDMEHPFFGMNKEAEEIVSEELDRLRRPCDAI